MKKTSLLIALGLLACSTVTSLASSLITPLLRYEFDQPGATQASTGSRSLSLTIKNYANVATDYITTAPVQRAGTTNSNALNFTFSNVDAPLDTGNRVRGNASAALNDTNAAFLRGELGSFTISTWVLDVQPRGGVSGARRLFTLRGSSGSVLDFYLSPSGPGNALTLITLGSEGSLTITAPSSFSIPSAAQEWYFISISYNASTGELNFYTGAEGGTLSTWSASNVIDGKVNALLTNATELAIGNVRYQDQRRFDGYISDFRFYDSELSAQDINGIYTIPEPGAALIFGTGVLVACLRSYVSVKR